VPTDRYYGRAAEVLARIEAGAGRERGDGIELRERCLEVFKVTSRGGAPEVWLLGQKVLGPNARSDADDPQKVGGHQVLGFLVPIPLPPEFQGHLDARALVGRSLALDRGLSVGYLRCFTLNRPRARASVGVTRCLRLCVVHPTVGP
jgi:hypothetical protein